ncbi:uncharacterized protein LAJ45_03876 [Morchella importuna]|uniref:uncharacterized protein n=1 Tax=Morchella importuna TaxID=1174673 RepID=UPI001E8D4ED9|nr:uncharacterized protein LAJ45_03876 [Morchella importuna]KAH8151883.1 hypothetical protein LAJ45_03876 [Morchella importuna]
MNILLLFLSLSLLPHTRAVAVWNWLFLIFPHTTTAVSGPQPYYHTGTISPSALSTIPRLSRNLASIISNTSAGMATFHTTLATFNTPLTYASHNCPDGPGICYFPELSDLAPFIARVAASTGERYDGVVTINQAANDGDGRWLGGNVRAACGYSEGQVEGDVFGDTGFGHCWIPMPGGDEGFRKFDEVFIHEMGHAVDMFYQRHGPEECQRRIPPEGHHILDQVDKAQNTYKRWEGQESGYFTGTRPDERIPEGSGISESCWRHGSPTRDYDFGEVRGSVRSWPGETPESPPAADGSGRLNEEFVDVKIGGKDWCGFDGIQQSSR